MFSKERTCLTNVISSKVDLAEQILNEQYSDKLGGVLLSNDFQQEFVVIFEG